VKAPYHPVTFVPHIFTINARRYLKLIILLEVLPNNILVVPGASLYLGKVWLDASMPLKLLYIYHLSHQCPAFPYIRL